MIFFFFITLYVLPIIIVLSFTIRNFFQDRFSLFEFIMVLLSMFIPFINLFFAIILITYLDEIFDNEIED
jgi:hypothetical protein